MLEYCEKALRISAGRSRQDLESDETLYLALSRAVELIGEAARHLSDSTRARHPAVPWLDIADTRNRLIHGYPEVDLDILWDIVALDLPELEPQLRLILKEFGGQDPTG